MKNKFYETHTKKKLSPEEYEALLRRREERLINYRKWKKNQ